MFRFTVPKNATWARANRVAIQQGTTAERCVPLNQARHYTPNEPIDRSSRRNHQAHFGPLPARGSGRGCCSSLPRFEGRLIVMTSPLTIDETQQLNQWPKYGHEHSRGCQLRGATFGPSAAQVQKVLRLGLTPLSIVVRECQHQREIPEPRLRPPESISNRGSLR